MRELYPALGDKDMFIWRADIDVTRKHRFSIFGLLHRLSRLSRQQARQVAFVARIEMLHHNDCREPGVNISQ